MITTSLFTLPQSSVAFIPPPDTVSLGLEIKDDFSVGFGPSRFYGHESDPALAMWCSTFDLPACTSATTLWGEINWDMCTPTSQLECIVEVWAIDPNGKRIAGEYVRNAPEEKTYDFLENTAINLPRSRGMGTVWRFPGAINSEGTDTYFVSVQSGLWMAKKKGDQVVDSRFTVSPPSAAIVAVKEMRGNFRPTIISDPTIGEKAGIGGGSALGVQGKCIAIGFNDCQKVAQIPENFRFGMKIQTTQNLTGWFHGRVLAPTISTELKFDRNTMRDVRYISIEAGSVKVPSIDFMVPNSQIPSEARALTLNGKPWEWGHSGTSQAGIKINTLPSSPFIFDLLRTFSPSYKNKASATDTQWSFKTLEYFENSKVGQCTSANQDVAGIVTTNALGYSPGPPSYSESSGNLEYRVTSPHLEANGTVATGTYDLVLKSDVARCIYGFSNAPIKAEISIVGDEGETRVATTTVNEKEGWLYLSAKGFTFSAPKIQVKLSQTPPPVVDAPKQIEVTDNSSKTTQELAASNTVVKPKVIKKTSITCTKGKAVRKVSGVSPKCPPGFKKR